MKRVYKIYNIERGAYGEPFTVCDNHYKKWAGELPRNLLVEKIADMSLEACQV